MKIFSKQGGKRDYVFILAGTFLMAVAINLFFDPMELVTGGVTGIGIVIKHLTTGILKDGIPVWVSNLAFNIPLFIISLRVFGFKYIAKTLFATLSLTLFLYLIPVTAVFETDLLLAAVFGGIISGAGIGLVFLTMSTTGGTDMLGMLIQKKKPYYSVPQLMLVIDGAVVISGAIAFGLTKALYAIITVYVVSKVSDGILDGLKFAKSAYIISDKSDEIAKEIMRELDRGVTGLAATGMYSGKEKNVLFCVVSRKQMVQVIEIVNRIDPTAFVTVNDVKEVRGEGFIEYHQ